MPPPVFPDLDLKPMIKGNVRIGRLNMSWDFTKLYEEREKEKKLERLNQMCQLKTGRIIMPALSIY